VSKSLKQMAYDTIEAHQETIADLRTQLAKANERISQYDSKQDKGTDLLIKLAKANARMASLELELAKANERVKELDQENKEFTMLIANLVRRADVKIDLLQNPTYEKASEQLNKFAIEKKIEALKEQLKRKSFKSVHDLIEIVIDSYENQLRKEQE